MTQFARCLRMERGDFFLSLSLSPSLGESPALSSAHRTRQSSFLFSFSVQTTLTVRRSVGPFFLHSSQGPIANMEPLWRQSYTMLFRTRVLPIKSNLGDINFTSPFLRFFLFFPESLRLIDIHSPLWFVAGKLRNVRYID